MSDDLFPPGGEPPAPPTGDPTAAHLAALREIMASPAIGIFMGRRVEQLVKHGHTPAEDRGLPLDHLPRVALERVKHALDKLTPTGGDIDYALAKIEIAGACLAAAHDVLRAAKAQGARADG